MFEPFVGQTDFQNLDKSVDREPILVYKTSKVDAFGKMTSEGFVVMANSKISLEIQQSFPENARRIREKHKEYISNEGILKIDVLCSSPSSAASFVGGSSLSGYATWKTEDGLNLRDLEN